MNLNQTIINYYHELADYDGVVAKAQMEIEGLTPDNYLNWYFQRCSLYYYSRTVPARGAFYDMFPIGGSWPRSANWNRLVQRRGSRLYVKRKMREVKATTLFFKQESSVRYNSESVRAVADEKLFLAQTLRKRAEALCKDASVLREARLGGWGMVASMASSMSSELYQPSTTGRRIGNIQTFQWLLAQFDEILCSEIEREATSASHATDSTRLEPAIELPIQQAASLSLRQTAMLYYYNEQPLTENNAAELAADKGHSSKTSGLQLLGHYVRWCELQEGEPPTSRRELGALARDLSCVIPQLDGQAAIQATAYQKQVIDKKKRGF